jgi:hypothetical protein
MNSNNSVHAQCSCVVLVVIFKVKLYDLRLGQNY